MKVYLYGIPVPMQYVTWELLCNPNVRVNALEDTHVDFPDVINEKAAQSWVKLSAWSTWWSQPWYKKIFRKGPSL